MITLAALGTPDFEVMRGEEWGDPLTLHPDMNQKNLR